MFYTLLFYPEFDPETKEKLLEFRKRYDPFVDSWKPHITFVFPVPAEDIDEEDLIAHIKSVLSRWKPFKVHIKGLEKSWDHWLFVLLDEGNDQLIQLHDELYTGPLKKYLREDIDFIPHIAIGLFTTKDVVYDLRDPKALDLDGPLFEKGMAAAREINFDLWNNLDAFALEKFDDELKTVLSSREIKLG